MLRVLSRILVSAVAVHGAAIKGYTPTTDVAKFTALGTANVAVGAHLKVIPLSLSPCAAAAAVALLC